MDNPGHRASPRKKSRGACRQKEHTDAVGKFFYMAANHLIGFVCHLAQYWHSEEVIVDTEGKPVENSENFVFTMPRTVTRSLTLPSVSKSFLSLHVDLFIT